MQAPGGALRAPAQFAFRATNHFTAARRDGERPRLCEVPVLSVAYPWQTKIRFSTS
jgi:hypothetical protein